MNKEKVTKKQTKEDKKGILYELKDIMNQATTMKMHESILYNNRDMYRTGWHDLKRLIELYINKEAKLWRS